MEVAFAGGPSRRLSSAGGTLGCLSCSESPTSSSSGAARAALAAAFSCAAPITSISASYSASTVGVPSCLKVLGLARGATDSAGSAPSARRRPSAAIALPSAAISSSFERCVPPDDQEMACSGKPRPSTRISTCSRR
eukprot:6175938-Pleurochrysis_carterae.AAC.2